MSNSIQTKIFTKTAWAWIASLVPVLATIAVLGYKYAKYEAKFEMNSEKNQEVSTKMDSVLKGLDDIKKGQDSLKSKVNNLELKVIDINSKMDNVTTSMERHIVKSNMSSDEMISQLNILRGVISVNEKKNFWNNLSAMSKPTLFLQTQQQSDSIISPEQLALKK